MMGMSLITVSLSWIFFEDRAFVSATCRPKNYSRRRLFSVPEESDGLMNIKTFELEGGAMSIAILVDGNSSWLCPSLSTGLA